MKFLPWFAALVVLCLAWDLSPPPQGAPLPPKSGARPISRDQAIRRGLRFIYSTATDPRNFEQWGGDYLWCFYCIASTSADRELSGLARGMGQERARQWRINHPSVPPDANADDVAALVFGSYAAECLGVPGRRLKLDLLRAASRFGAADFLGFDPRQEPPPADIPQSCPKCGAYNARGVRVCRRCGTPLAMSSRYDVFQDALITAYSGDAYGVRLGCGLEDVLQWLPAMRPYRPGAPGKDPDWDQLAYTVTHVVYVLNGYSRFRLQPSWLPAEFDFLRANLRRTFDTGDTETAGEFLDTLKSFGLSDRDPLIRAGSQFILSRQNPDGSWGDPNTTDIYARYHPTWTAIDGLRDYPWRPEGVTSNEALRRAQGHLAAGPPQPTLQSDP